jgi:hypothetical protein
VMCKPRNADAHLEASVDVVGQLAELMLVPCELEMRKRAAGIYSRHTLVPPRRIWTSHSPALPGVLSWIFHSIPSSSRPRVSHNCHSTPDLTYSTSRSSRSCNNHVANLYVSDIAGISDLHDISDLEEENSVNSLE